jgi:V/A-type H+/Na+-transporting ATPase subunit E
MATDKLQELIETLKKQGIQKGEESAARILESAQKEAGEILANAKTQANAIIEQAKNESDGVMKRLQSSMEIAASQFVGNLKRVLENNLLTLPLKEKLTTELSDAGFLKDLITQFVKTYASNPENPDIDLLLPAGVQESLKNYAVDLMVQHCKGDASKEILVMESHGIRFGFQVDKKDGNVRLDFTDEAFLALFIEFLAPKFRELFTSLKLSK